MKVIKNGIVRDVQNHELYVKKGWALLEIVKSAEENKKIEDMTKAELKDLILSKNIQVENIDKMNKDALLEIVKSAEANN